MHSKAELPSSRVKSANMEICGLGFGGASVGNLYRASSDEVARATIDEAVSSGITYIDTAPHYGHGLSEVRIGQFLKECDRSSITLSTKVGRVLEPSGPEGPPDHGFVDPLPFTQVYDYSYDGVMRSFEQSCERLGVDTVDILYMHDIGALTHGEDSHPELFRQAMSDGVRAMEELKSGGQTKAIGLGVNEWEVCVETFGHADFDVFMLAGRHTLLEQPAMDTFLPECLQRGVSVVCASPFNSGLLAKRPTTKSHYNYDTPPEAIIARANHIFDVCQEMGVNAQAAALQFPLLHPCIVSVVSGMSSSQRVRQAIAWWQETIPDQVWTALQDEGIIDARIPLQSKTLP